jgi:hypothetical protein
MAENSFAKDKLNLSDDAPQKIYVVSPTALEWFKRAVMEDGAAPSQALRGMMQEFACPALDAGVVISFVKVTWPDADFHGSGLRSRIIDAAYPNGDAAQFSDQDFDDGIAQMLADSWN